MKKRKKIILLTGLGLFFSAVSISAFSEVSALFQAVSGKVEVHLEEYKKEEDKEVLWEDGEMVLPGGVVSKIPRICNDADACYVRAAVEFDSERDSGHPLTTEELVGISQDWVQIGDYFYYKNILPENGSVDFFQGIRIPPEWEDGVDDDNQWSADVKVDAIQAAFFQPDFSSEDPWGLEKEGYTIQNAVDRQPTEQEENNAPIKLEIEQDMKGFSVEDQEFFREFESFVPGKFQTGTLEFTNKTKKAREVFMKAETLEKNEFLEGLELVIRIREKDRLRVLYQGDMLSEKLQEYQSLGTVPANGTETVEFAVRLPKKADNRYSASQGKVKYWFTTDLPAEETSLTAVETGDSWKKWIIPGILLPIPVLFFGICKICRRYRKGGRRW